MKKSNLILLPLLLLLCNSKSIYYWPKALIEHYGKLDKVTLINDALILRIDVNGNKKPAEKMTTISNDDCFPAVKSILGNKNYSVVNSSNSFQGAFINDPKVEDIYEFSKALPLKIDTLMFNDERSLNSYLLLLRSIYSGMNNSEKSLTVDHLANIPKIAKACSIIQDKINTRYLVINIFYGMQCPKQGRNSQTIGRSILRSAFSDELGLASSAFKSYSFFIDLETAQVLWSKYYKSGSDVLHGSDFMQNLYQKEILNDLPRSPNIGRIGSD